MNTLDYTCTKCGRIKRYKIKKAYEKALIKNKPCQLCLQEEQIQYVENSFHNWVKQRQQTNCPNKTSCEFMDELNKMGYEFRHGLNGGEEFLDISYTDFTNNCHRGIFLDGWDDKHKIVFEWDEPSHNVLDRAMIDFDRQNQIFLYYKKLNIDIKFVRFDEENCELYEVEPQNPYNLLMIRTLKHFTGELKKWYNASENINRDTVVFEDMVGSTTAFHEFIQYRRKKFRFKEYLQSI